MSVSVKYKGNVITEMEESGTKTLKTGGMYCEDDITIEHTVTVVETPAEPVAERVKRWDITVASGKPASGTILTLLTDEWLKANRTNAGLRVTVAPKGTLDTTTGQQFFFYNGNSPYLTVNGTSYYSVSAFAYNNGVSLRNRNRSLSMAVNDIGDIDITTSGALRVVAYGTYTMAVGDFTVTAWIDDA